MSASPFPSDEGGGNHPCFSTKSAGNPTRTLPRGVMDRRRDFLYFRKRIHRVQTEVISCFFYNVSSIHINIRLRKFPIGRERSVSAKTHLPEHPDGELRERRGRNPTRAALLLRLQLDPFSLTKKEAGIVLLLLEDRSNEEIADTEAITRNTLKTHLRHIYRKLHVTGGDRTSRITEIATRLGLR